MKRKLVFKARNKDGSLKNVGYVEAMAEDQEEGTPVPGEEEEEETMVPEEEPEEDKVTLNFYGDICGAQWESEWYEEDKCPQDISDFFNSIPDNKDIDMYFNSGGGDAYAGVAIGNIIRRHKGKTRGFVDGIAASAASVILFSCDEVIVNVGGQIMIHKPMTWAGGNADDFKVAINRLNQCQNSIVDTYMEKAKEGVTRDQINALVNKETWFDVTKAQQYFNVEAGTGATVAACNSEYYGRYKNTPANLLKTEARDTNDIVNIVLAAMRQQENEKREAEKQKLLAGLDEYGM